MHSIPDTIDLNLLVGANIQQVCFSANNIVIIVESIGFVQIESHFTYRSNKVMEKQFHPFTCSSELGVLLNLIEKTITKIETDEARMNLIIFTNDDQRLEILNDEHYESMQLKIGKIDVIV